MAEYDKNNSMTTLSDSLLLQRIVGGDEASFEVLFYRHYDRVYGLLFRLLGNRVEAEDVTQELFLKLYRRPLSGKREHNLTSWLYRVATNSSLDVLRRRRRDRSHHTSLDDAPAGRRETVSEDPGQDRLLFSSQVNERLGAALFELSELERTAFTLRHFENFPLAEISLSLGISTNSTKQAVFRAVKKVRRTLEPVVRMTS